MEITNYKIKKRIKYNIDRIINLLSDFKQIWYSYLTRKKGIYYLTMISFSRLDIIPNLKKEYPNETYVLTVEKGKLKTFDPFDYKSLLIDERHEFHTVEEIIDYLDKKGYLKKKDWIKDE